MENQCLISKILYTWILFLIFSCSTKLEYLEIKDDIWKPVTSNYSKTEFKNKLTFVFEKNFNDSISVFSDSRLLFSNIYKTKKSLSVVPIFEKIDFSAADYGEYIHIHSFSKNERVKFRLKRGYSYVYINRDEYGKWFIEYSEYKRNYF